MPERLAARCRVEVRLVQSLGPLLAHRRLPRLSQLRLAAPPLARPPSLVVLVVEFAQSLGGSRDGAAFFVPATARHTTAPRSGACPQPLQWSQRQVAAFTCRRASCSAAQRALDGVAIAGERVDGGWFAGRPGGVAGDCPRPSCPPARCRIIRSTPRLNDLQPFGDCFDGVAAFLGSTQVPAGAKAVGMTQGRACS
jgi:hypothetical protein